MPTPYGSRGGVAFSADELRVLGGALAIALQSDPAPEEARDYLRLAEAVDETVREGYRLRSFLLADLARYREALPGAAPGYLDQLEAALTMGYLPRPDDLAALRTLCGEAAGAPETARRLGLLRRCESLAERAVRARMCIVPGGRTPLHDTTAPSDLAKAAPSDPATAGKESGEEPEPGPRGSGAKPEEPGGSETEPEEQPDPEPDSQPDSAPSTDPAPSSPPAPSGPAPSDPAPSSPDPEAAPHAPPSRPVPTPAEVFPPRRDPARPSERGAPKEPEEPAEPEGPVEPEPPEAPGSGEAPEPPAPAGPPPVPPATDRPVDCAEERDPVFV